tara:strand:+ start:1223 stop:2320 length:1098 start_codon:yes stop_codon:yes gene_type:complete
MTKITIPDSEYDVQKSILKFLGTITKISELEVFSFNDFKNRVNLAPYFETLSIDYLSSKLNIECKIEGLSHKFKHFIRKERTIFVQGETAEQFINDAIEYSENSWQRYCDDNHIVSLEYNYSWTLDGVSRKRDPFSVHLPKGQVDKVFSDLNQFREEKERYHELNIPYMRTYMFYGLPGTGKTTLIKAIASKYNMTLCNVVVNKDLEDSDIKRAFRKLPKHSIMVLEDIDCIFKDRKEGDTIKNNLTFSGLLNSLDGIAENDDRIIIMTTNNLDCLDKALIRRIDFFMKFDYANQKQIEDCFKRFFPNSDFSEFYQNIRGIKLTINILQKFFTKHLRDNIIEVSKELPDFSTGELSLESTKNMYT